MNPPDSSKSVPRAATIAAPLPSQKQLYSSLRQLIDDSAQFFQISVFSHLPYGQEDLTFALKEIDGIRNNLFEAVDPEERRDYNSLRSSSSIIAISAAKSYYEPFLWVPYLHGVIALIDIKSEPCGKPSMRRIHRIIGEALDEFAIHDDHLLQYRIRSIWKASHRDLRQKIALHPTISYEPVPLRREVERRMLGDLILERTKVACMELQQPPRFEIPRDRKIWKKVASESDIPRIRIHGFSQDSNPSHTPQPRN